MRAIAKDRSLFFKGFKLSKQGSYEDPTYLGFKIVFDFGGLPVDDYGQPPSPLFKDANYTLDNSNFASLNPFGQPEYDHIRETERIAYYSAQKYLEEREFDFNQSSSLFNDSFNLFNINRESKLGGIASKIDEFRNSYAKGKRSDMLRQFKVLLQNINKNSPWFFQSIEGLDELAKIDQGGYNGKDTDAFSPFRTMDRSITINCLESMDLRISALADLYRMATFDQEFMRELLPRNLRYFKMFIFVSEIRNINKTARLSGSAAAVKAVNDLNSFLASNVNPGTRSTLDSIQGGVNKIFPGGSSPGGSFNSFVGNIGQQSGFTTKYDVLEAQSDQAGIKPVMMYECSQCEFDFDNSTPIKRVLDMGTGSADPVGQSFKIHIGRVKLKNQYPNIRLDGLPLILSEGWDSNRSSVQRIPRLGEGFVGDLLSAGQDLMTNFVSNAMGDMITEGIAMLTAKKKGQPIETFDKVYNFSESEKILDKHNTYFNSSNPQQSGFGGPPDRVYPIVNDDVYPSSPGPDLGVPDRVYPTIDDDVYPNVPEINLNKTHKDIKDKIYKKDIEGKINSKLGGVYSLDKNKTETIISDKVYNKSDIKYDNNILSNLYQDDEKISQKDKTKIDEIYLKQEILKGDKKIKEDVYKNSPGLDLGIKSPNKNIVDGREYKKIKDSVYDKKRENKNINKFDKVYPEVTGNFNDNELRKKEAENIPNIKPHTKWDISLGDNHPRREKFNE